MAPPGRGRLTCRGVPRLATVRQAEAGEAAAAERGYLEAARLAPAWSSLDFVFPV